MKFRANLWIGGVLFAAVVVGGTLAPWLAHTDPVMDANLMNAEVQPGAEFWFGTDAQGRDIYTAEASRRSPSCSARLAAALSWSSTAWKAVSTVCR